MTVSYGQNRAILATRHVQADRERAFTALHETYKSSLNTYATLYNAVCQRDWFQARARGYKTTLEAALHGDNIPTSVVENLIETTRAGVAPLRRYHKLRRRMLKVPPYHVYDFAIPLITVDKKYNYDEVLDWIVDAVAPLGPDYQALMRQGFSSRWIDVYENEGKRSAWLGAGVRHSPCTCCSTTPTRWTTCSRRRTRWGTRCTPSCRTRRSRSSTRTTRSLSPKSPRP